MSVGYFTLALYSPLPMSLDLLAQSIARLQHLASEDERPSLTFETIALPLQWLEILLDVWTQLYPPEVLQQLDATEPETLEAWAIALTRALDAQLQWLDRTGATLDRLSLLDALQTKIADRTRQLQQLRGQNNELLAKTGEFSAIDGEMRDAIAELEQLQQEAENFDRLRGELERTDLDGLRASIARDRALLAPQQAQLRELEREKADLDGQIEQLRRQQSQLGEEIELLRGRRDRLQLRTEETAKAAIADYAGQRDRLGDNLQQLLDELDSQRREYDRLRGELDRAIAESNEYQTAIRQGRNALETHYRTDVELGRRLPTNGSAIARLVGAIEENLAALDRELTRAQQENEAARVKQIFTF
jgi:chromosome segregation ATPase